MSETRGRGSAGMPSVGGDDRVTELEDRLARLEGGPKLRERGLDLMGRVMPPEASRHFRNAGREQLLGIRSIVDFWIRRIELMESQSGSGESNHEKITID